MSDWKFEAVTVSATGRERKRLDFYTAGFQTTPSIRENDRVSLKAMCSAVEPLFWCPPLRFGSQHRIAKPLFDFLGVHRWFFCPGTKFQGKIKYACFTHIPPPLPPFWPEGIFWGGAGVYNLKPPAAGILYPPLLSTFLTPGRVFSGVGGCMKFGPIEIS